LYKIRAKLIFSSEIQCKSIHKYQTKNILLVGIVILFDFNTVHTI
jgi:hypothetical protein